jgi:hypothetical protein
LELKGKLVKFLDNCKGSIESPSSKPEQMALFSFTECNITAGETGIVLEEERIDSISETFINALIGNRVVYDIRVSGSYGLVIEVFG